MIPEKPTTTEASPSPTFDDFFLRTPEAIEKAMKKLGFKVEVHFTPNPPPNREQKIRQMFIP